ncbi:pentatricopeptide repeat-containing protein At5g14770, mitochondrial-like isoform X2 [Euphorbia lathyris]
MQEIRAKEMAKSSYPYNLLTNLYSRNGELDKINTLIQEMERNGIRPDKYTLSNLLAASVAVSDISGMEKILNQMNEDPQLVQDSRTYSMAANGYLKVGLIEPALTILKKMEQMLPLEKSIMAFGDLLNLYGKTGRKDELHRVWNTYQKLFEINDETFCCMMSSVLNLGDIEGAERISKEWESKCTEYDSRVMNRFPVACSGLWKRIKNVKDPKALVEPVLDQWISEGNTVKRPLLRSLIWLLQGHRRYDHATEISNWMNARPNFTLSPNDAAARLGLIRRTCGLEHAETYFNTLSFDLRTYGVYSALLSCYVQENSVQKAEEIMQEMREKGMAASPFPYTLLINLYYRNGNFDKINLLIHEMERNGISPDKYTMSSLMGAYAAASDITGMENILNQINNDPQLVEGWITYAKAANGYLKVGLTEPALMMLRKIEKIMPFGRSTKAFHGLLTQYAKTGRKDELYRVWNKYKQLVELNDETFCCMISSLLKLEDIEGAEQIFEEWQLQSTGYDFHVLNKLLVAYCKKGLLEKAEAAVGKAAERRTPHASTWSVLARGYVEQNQIPKAVEMFNREISVSEKGWRPDPIVLKACLDYLEAQGDAEGMEELIMSLKRLEPLTEDINRRLTRTYIASGKVEDLHQSMMNDFPADEEMNKLITRSLPTSHLYFSSSSSYDEEDSGLWNRIKITTDPKASLVPVLDQWISEGNAVRKPILESLILLLQRERRYNHALEISHWMTKRQCYTLSPADAAIRLSLFERARGLEHAETYFSQLSDELRTYDAYATLLCCYVQENSVQKAEAIMQEMREKGIAKLSYPYNLLTNLYARNGYFDKINILIQEMERNGISPNKYTMWNQMSACATASNISGMEKILNQINNDPNLADEWTTYSMAAYGYLKVGLIEPALTMLRKVEELLPLERSTRAFDRLLSLYEKTGMIDELYRVWNTYKHLVELNDETFCCMMASVLKLGDIEGAERISEEWDSQCREYDFRVMNRLPVACSRLWKRIKIVKDPKASVVPVLDQWISEGNTIEEPLFTSLIWLLRGYRCYNHANEITHWVTKRRYFSLTPSGAAVRLGLIHKTHGVEQAETYFNELPNELKSYHVYGALLCCYVKENSVKKAEAIMQEMREKGMTKTPYPYNLLTTLYSRKGELDKINLLVQEMKRNGLTPNRFTMGNLMAGYVATSNISGMEETLNQVNKTPRFIEWQKYSIAANGYLESGLIEPAFTMLRKMEEIMPLGKDTKAFNYLLTLYVKTGRKDELYRVWNKYRQSVQLNVDNVCCMISSLSKLEDIEGAERIFEEWESHCTKYDFRVLNRLLIAYSKNGLLEKAEAAVVKTAEGRKIYPSTWNVLAREYTEHNQMCKAVEMFKKAISASQNSWKPCPTVLNACLYYLEEQGDVEGMQELIKSLKNLEPLTKDMYHRLERTSIATGKVHCLDQTLMNEFPTDEEINKILPEAKSSAGGK